MGSKIMLVDIYPLVPYRICKDLAGGYGTGNDFGDGFFGNIIKRLVKKSINFPPIEFMEIGAILRNRGYSVEYTQNIADVGDDVYACVFSSSIVCSESEREAISQCSNGRIFVVGIVAQQFKELYEKAGAFVVPGEPSPFFQHANLDIYPNFPAMPQFVTNLDDIPFPAWDLYIDKYSLNNNFVGKGITIPIYATKGCPYSCSHYCTYPLQQGKKVRFRSVEKLIDEIKHWKERGATNFLFRDPVFSVNREFTEKLANAMIKNNLNINYMIETHLNNLDEPLVTLLGRSGLNLVYVGVESVDMDVIDDMKRFSIEKDEERRIIKLVRSLGITVKAMFIIGCPKDTHETVHKTIEFAKFIEPSFAQFSVFTPYPGTRCYDEFEDRITAERLENFDQYRLVYKHDYLSEADIRNLLEYAYSSFYLRAKFIWQFLLDRLSPGA